MSASFPDLLIAFQEAVEALKIKLSNDETSSITYNGETIFSIAKDISEFQSILNAYISDSNLNISNELSLLTQNINDLVSSSNMSISNLVGSTETALDSTIAQVIADIDSKWSAVQALVDSALVFETKVAMDAVTPTVDPNGNYPLAKVWGDTETNNGIYGYSGSAWVKSEYDPMTYSMNRVAELKFYDRMMNETPTEQLLPTAALLSSSASYNWNVSTDSGLGDGTETCLLNDISDTEHGFPLSLPIFEFALQNDLGAYQRLSFNNASIPFSDIGAVEGDIFTFILFTKDFSMPITESGWTYKRYMFSIMGGVNFDTHVDIGHGWTAHFVTYALTADDLVDDSYHGKIGQLLLRTNAGTATYTGKVAPPLIFKGDCLAVMRYFRETLGLFFDDMTIPKVQSASHADESDSSDYAGNAGNAGTDFILPDNVLARKAAVISGSDGVDDGITLTKDVSTLGSTWFGITFHIQYENLEDLNRLFFSFYEYISGIEPTHFNVTTSPTGDWSTPYSPVFFTSILLSGGVNLYEAIAESVYSSVYEGINDLYINIAFHNADTSIIDAAEAVWKFNPYIENENYTVVASKFNKQLNDAVNTSISNAVRGVDKGVVIQAGVANGDSSNSSISLEKYLYNGEIVGSTTTATYSGSSYLYSYHYIATAYADVSDKKLRILFKSNSAASFSFRLLGQTNWSLGTIVSQSITLDESNNYLASVDIDLSDAAIQAYYATDGKPQAVVYAIVWEGSLDRDEIQVSTCYYDIESADVSDFKSGKFLSLVGMIADSAAAKISSLESSVEALTNDLQAASDVVDKLTAIEIVCWGDSLTAGGGWTTQIQTLSGVTVLNGGTGGENSKTIMARQGGDVMMVNNITIPADTDTSVLIADRDVDGGIATYFGNLVTPLYQGGSTHVNPCMIGDVEGTLQWTGSSYADTTGDWTFTRNEAGEEVVIKRPTAIRTGYDRNHNSGIIIIFIGQNGGYSDIDDLIWQHKMMLQHTNAKHHLILGLSSGSADLRADYEAAMEAEFGRYFVSLREYLAHPIYDTDGTTIISCYGLEDSGLTATEDDLAKIATGTVPLQLLSDSVHYTTLTKTIIGTMLYKKMVELNMFD